MTHCRVNGLGLRHVFNLVDVCRVTKQSGSACLALYKAQKL